MKRFIVGLFGVIAVVAVALTLVAARFEPKIVPGAMVGLVSVGGLTRDEAAFKLRQWWETEKVRPLQLRAAKLKGEIPPTSASKLGLALDDVASVDQLPLEDFWQNASNKITRGQPERTQFEPQFTYNEETAAWLVELVRERGSGKQKAQVFWRSGSIVRKPEAPGLALNAAELPTAVVAALGADGVVELPLVEGAKRVPDEALAEITGVIGEFSTKFPARQHNRNANIKLASSKFEGIVLMPGETVSFNQTVGRRTSQAGFKLAGVYANGRHDTGIGGGICQVSTTLYNAALLGNLKIKERRNHSMPVAYVPLGRDATVDYGSIDLVIENNQSFPIGIAPEYTTGQIVFRILGKPNPAVSVKILASGHKSWDTGIQQVKDPSLRAGVQKVIEKGSRGHSVNTTRVVYKNGKEVGRESLGQSHYRGGKKIVAVGTQSAAPVAATVGTTPTTGREDFHPDEEIY
jgi:vancomycin resistance protein YoaR